MYWIELIATRQCNRSCYYCTTHALDSVDVDIDYLKWVLDQCPTNLGVEFTGGEIGLLTNLDETYRCIKNHPHVQHIIVLSNGLVRQLGVDWLNEVEYWEHLIDEIKGKEIIKFYPLDLEYGCRYMTIATKTTTKSLLTNWEYFESMGLFRPNFTYKIMNHKSNTTIESYSNDLIKLYMKLGDRYLQNMIMQYRLKSYLKDEKELCERFSPNPFVDLQRKQLGHCAINVRKSDKWEFSKENLEKLKTGQFYRGCDYCKTCYSFDCGKHRDTLNNRSYKR